MKKITVENIEAALARSRVDTYESELMRVPLEVENQIIGLVCEGRPNDIRIHRFSQVRGNMGNMAESEKKQLEYACVSMAAILSRAVLDVGVSPDDSFDLSDVILMNLSKTDSMQDLDTFYRLIPVLFARLVERSKNAKCSHPVEMAQNYICRNIFRKLTLSEIAEYSGVNANYLSTIFTREVGFSVTNYIQKEKTNVACNLLSHTDLPIIEIATYMGFASQSTFSTVFRKWQHETPSGYRARTYSDVF